MTIIVILTYKHIKYVRLINLADCSATLDARGCSVRLHIQQLIRRILFGENQLVLIFIISNLAS
jgi:hypothetical protein